jgi:hypothetical protein
MRSVRNPDSNQPDTTLIEAIETSPTAANQRLRLNGLAFMPSTV